jgi:hypothetical protein
MFCIYLEESTNKAAPKAHADRSAAPPDTSETMTAATVTAAATVSAEIQQVVRRDVVARWNKFSEQDLSALKDRDDLVREVVSRYGIENGEAQRDVDFVLKGRQI